MLRSLLASFVRSRRGNIAVLAALTAPILVGGLAISVDYGAIVRQQRSLQANVDLAAIAAASDPQRARVLLQQFYADNHLNYAVRDGATTYLPDGSTVSSQAVSEKDIDCIASLDVGHYKAVAQIPLDERFQQGALPNDAVRVAQTCKGHLYFASNMVSAPNINVTATASAHNLASFWIGSRLGSINGGLFNAVLSALFGTSISLNVVDYQSLMTARVDVLSTISALSTQINMTGASYNDLLDANITLAQFYRAVRVGGDISASAQVAFRTLELTVGRSNRTFKLSEILNLTAIGDRPVGSGYGSASRADALDLIRASAAVSNGTHQVETAFVFKLPGLGDVDFRLVIGEPPVGAQSIAINTAGGIVRTAQVRARITFHQGTLPGMAGFTLNLPIYLEVADSEAKLSGIDCRAGSVAGVRIETYPGLSEFGIGDVDPDAFINFGKKPRVRPTTLLTVPGVKVNGSAQVDVNNLVGTFLNFSKSDIDGSQVKNTNVRSPYTSYMSSLIKNINLNVQAGGFSFGTDEFLYRNALISALSNLTIPADQLLVAFLSVMGIKIGEADVSVTGASCGTATLVQ